MYLYYTHRYKHLCRFLITVFSSFLFTSTLFLRKFLSFWSSKRAHVKSVKREAGGRSLATCSGRKTERSNGDLGFLFRLYSPSYQTWKRGSKWVQKPLLEMNPTFAWTVLRAELVLRVEKIKNKSTLATRSHLINICYIGLKWRKLSDSMYV